MSRVLFGARLRATVAGALLVAAGFAGPASAGTASMSGTVTDASTGAPVEGACVLLWKDEGDIAYEQYPHACTDATGRWEKTGLEAGVYAVEATAAEYVTQWAYRQSYFWQGERFTLGDGDSTTVNLALERAGRVVGRLTDELTGEPIAGVCAQVNGPRSFDDCTDENGEYAIEGIEPSDGYTLYFADWSENRYVAEYAPDSYSWEGARQYTVVGGETLTVDAALAPGASISGTIIDENGAVAPELCVVALREADSYDAAGYGCADSEGRYTVTGLAPGPWYLQADDHSGAHPRAYYPNATHPSGASTISVTAGQQVDGADLTLVAAGSVTGLVTKAATGEPMAGVCVMAVRADDDVFLYNGGPDYCTGEDGRYTVRGMPTGGFRLHFGPSDNEYVPVWSGNADQREQATIIQVTAGEQTAGVDAAIKLGGRISGRVVDAVTKKPVAGTCVTVGVYDSRADDTGSQWPSACTGADGRYELRGLNTGEYKVQFYDREGDWAWQFFPHKPDHKSAAWVQVTAGETLTGINAKLKPTAVVSGVVTNAVTGLPAKQVCVAASSARDATPSSSAIGTSMCTDDLGRYTIRGLSTGQVKLEFGDGEWHYVTEWAYDKPDRASATPIGVTSGLTTPVNVSVSPK